MVGARKKLNPRSIFLLTAHITVIKFGELAERGWSTEELNNKMRKLKLRRVKVQLKGICVATKSNNYVGCYEVESRDLNMYRKVSYVEKKKM